VCCEAELVGLLVDQFGQKQQRNDYIRARSNLNLDSPEL